MPIYKKYMSVNMFLFQNDYMGPIPRKILSASDNSKMYEYRYKSEIEAGYIVYLEDEKVCKQFEEEFIKEYNDFTPIEDAIVDEVIYGSGEKISLSELEEYHLQKEFVEGLCNSIEEYQVVRKRVYIEDNPYTENRERIDLVLLDEKKCSIIQIARLYYPSNR